MNPLSESSSSATGRPQQDPGAGTARPRLTPATLRRKRLTSATSVGDAPRPPCRCGQGRARPPGRAWRRGWLPSGRPAPSPLRAVGHIGGGPWAHPGGRFGTPAPHSEPLQAGGRLQALPSLLAHRPQVLGGKLSGQHAARSATWAVGARGLQDTGGMLHGAPRGPLSPNCL